VRFSSYVLSASKHGHIWRIRASNLGDRVIKRFGNNAECKPTDPSNIGGITARVARAQKARWAEVQEESQPAKTMAPAPTKRTMSAAARRKIATFQKARWAKIRGQQKKAA